MRRFTLLALAAVVGVVALALAGTAAATAFGGAVWPASAKTRPEAAMTGTASRAASCSRGSKPAIIAGNFMCLRVGQRCSMRYQGSYRKYSFHCVNNRLRRGTGVTVTPPQAQAPPATPPAPTPSALDGHYKGVTSQNETFEFDIINGGRSFRGLKTGQINQGCTPYGSLYGGNYDWPNYVASVALSGDFTIDTDVTYGAGTNSVGAGHLTIRGHMAGQSGIGSLEVKLHFTGSDGVACSCGSGLQSWTVTRTG
jgi:hypothetical protein